MPRLRGKGGAVRHQRGESHRRWLIIVMPILPYDTESKSRNADFILIAQEGDTTTLGAKGPVKLKNPWAEGPFILRTFSFTTLLHNPRRQPRPFFIKLAAEPPPQPSAQRAVKPKNL